MLADLARNLREMTWAWRLGAVAAIAFVLVYASMGAPYYQSLLMSIAMYVVLCSSWNVISGFAGYVSFGHVAFWGLGAYLTAILINVAGWPWQAALIGAGLGTATFALLVSLPLLRLSGVYFAISMLALAEAVKVAIIYSRPLTGGQGDLSSAADRGR